MFREEIFKSDVWVRCNKSQVHKMREYYKDITNENQAKTFMDSCGFGHKNLFVHVFSDKTMKILDGRTLCGTTDAIHKTNEELSAKSGCRIVDFENVWYTSSKNLSNIIADMLGVKENETFRIRRRSGKYIVLSNNVVECDGVEIKASELAFLYMNRANIVPIIEPTKKREFKMNKGQASIISKIEKKGYKVEITDTIDNKKVYETK